MTCSGRFEPRSAQRFTGVQSPGTARPVASRAAAHVRVTFERRCQLSSLVANSASLMGRDGGRAAGARTAKSAVRSGARCRGLRAMRRLAAITIIALSIAACGASDGVSRSGTVSLARVGQPGRTVLVLTQTLGFHHASIPFAVDVLRRVAARDGRYRVVFLPSASRLTPTALKGAAAVVFLLTTGDLPLSQSEKHALVAFVHDGGGLVGFHSATDTFHHWPGYIRLIGAEFSYHPVPSTERLVVEDHSAPATRALPTSFTIHEEFYVFKHDPRPHVHVLVRLATPRSGPDRPLVWCRRSGRGRVFYDALGHFPQTWSDSRQLVLVSGGIEWAAGLASAPTC
jgi:uncharacterized protein